MMTVTLTKTISQSWEQNSLPSHSQALPSQQSTPRPGPPLQTHPAWRAVGWGSAQAQPGPAHPAKQPHLHGHRNRHCVSLSRCWKGPAFPHETARTRHGLQALLGAPTTEEGVQATRTQPGQVTYGPQGPGNAESGGRLCSPGLTAGTHSHYPPRGSTEVWARPGRHPAPPVPTCLSPSKGRSSGGGAGSKGSSAKAQDHLGAGPAE